MVADRALRSNLLDAHAANYQKLRIRQGLHPGSQFERQPPTASRNSRAQAPTGIKLVEPHEAIQSEEDAPTLWQGDPEDLALTEEAGENA